MFDEITIDQCLPQSQCQQCGYKTCFDYAVALSNDSDTINKCAYGGANTMEQLSVLLKKSQLPLIKDDSKLNVKAYIDETNCIGCTKCLDVCPVDAIVGGKKQLHTVLTDFCTGCQLCLTPCPTDCISLVPSDQPKLSADTARFYFNRKQSRLSMQKQLHTKSSQTPRSIIQVNNKSTTSQTLNTATPLTKQPISFKLSSQTIGSTLKPIIKKEIDCVVKSNEQQPDRRKLIQDAINRVKDKKAQQATTGLTSSAAQPIDRKTQVQEAIERAKAKKMQAQAHPIETKKTDTMIDRKQLVLEAIERAKNKKQNVLNKTPNQGSKSE